MDDSGVESWPDALKRYGINFGWWLLCFTVVLLVVSLLLGPTLLAAGIGAVGGLVAAPRLPWRTKR